MERKTKAATESGALLFIIAGILVALNVVSAFGLYFRKDTTKAERYTLSKGSGSLLRSLKQDKMTADVYVTKGLPKLDAFVRDLRDLLVEYKNASGGKFDFTIIEAKDEEQKRKAKEDGLMELKFGEANQDEEKAAVTVGYMGIVLKYGPEKDVIKALSPDQTTGLEFWITNKIRELRDKGDNIKHKIGVLGGHDELKLTETNLVPANMGKPNLQQIISQNFPFYEFVDVELKEGAEKIDENLDGLIITQPGKDYSDKELRRIDEFMMRGKSLAVFASAVNVKASDATMNATLNTHGLEKLLDGYGVEMRKDAVLDFGRSFRIGMMTQGGGMAAVRFPQFLDVQDDARFSGDEQLLDTSFAGFFRIPNLVVPFASSLVLHADKQPEASVRAIMRTTPRSLRETGETVDLKPLRAWKPKGEFAQFAIAASVEGKLKTAFPAGDKMGIEAPATSTSPSRILVLSSSQFLSNPCARAGNGMDMGGQMGMMMPMGGDEQLQQLAGPYAQQALTNTIVAFKNTLDWITGDVDLLAVSAKILTEPGLVYGDVSKPTFQEETDEQAAKRDEEMKAARKVTQRNVQWTLILGAPLLFAAFGFLFRYLRRSYFAVSL